MTLFQRIRKFLFGILLLFIAIIFLASPGGDTYQVVIGVLAIGLAIKAIKDIVFYFSMARHMVGGKMILFQGVIILDFAIFTASLSQIPKIYILLYLIFINAFSGVVEVLRALEAKRTVEGPWKLKMGHGVINLALAISCLVFIRNENTAMIIYSIGLMYSALMRIISAFRRTTFVTIQ